MNATTASVENATGTEDRSIDHARYERACHEEMAISWDAPNMATVGHNDEDYGVDLVEGACECPDSMYRHVYCKHIIKAALAAIYEQGVTTAFVATVARYVADHPCPFDNHTICTGPIGATFPCQECVEATTVGEWTVWQQTRRAHGGTAMSGELTATKLIATPVGTPDGDVICDSCNKSITTARQLRKQRDEAAEPTVHIYATCVYGTRRWALRWTNCEDCGSLGDGEVNESGEAHATATLMLHPNHETRVMVADATITACSPPG